MRKSKAVLYYTIIAVIVCVATALLIPYANVMGRLSNGLFLAGILLLCVGGLGAADYLGGFDLITFAYAKLVKYSKKNVNDPEMEDIGQYHDYQRRKYKTKSFVVPVVIGSITLFLSLFCLLFA